MQIYETFFRQILIRYFTNSRFCGGMYVLGALLSLEGSWSSFKLLEFVGAIPFTCTCIYLVAPSPAQKIMNDKFIKWNNYRTGMSIVHEYRYFIKQTFLKQYSTFFFPSVATMRRARNKTACRNMISTSKGTGQDLNEERSK